MRKEFVCKACGGIGKINEHHKGLIGQRDVIKVNQECPSCTDGHIPLPEMLMLVNEALCDANRAFREKHTPYSNMKCMEHYVAIAYQRFMDVTKILEVEITYIQEAETKDVPENISESIMVLIDQILMIRYQDHKEWAETFVTTLNCFCAYHKVNLPAHIEALIAYEKESEG